MSMSFKKRRRTQEQNFDGGLCLFARGFEVLVDSITPEFCSCFVLLPLLPFLWGLIRGGPHSGGERILGREGEYHGWFMD